MLLLQTDIVFKFCTEVMTTFMFLYRKRYTLDDFICKIKAPQATYPATAIICLCVKVFVAKMSGKKLMEGQITILNQILIISMHIASLFKRPCYLFKLWSGNENMGVFRAGNSVKI